jgi:DNA invertase Pin-like site-specific DNA recombinase
MKAALQAAKARGVVLGGPKIDEARIASAAVRRAAADQHAANVMPIIEAFRKVGVVKQRDIAAALNARGIATARGGRWHPSTVQNILARTLGENHGGPGVCPLFPIWNSCFTARRIWSLF